MIDKSVSVEKGSNDSNSGKGNIHIEKFVPVPLSVTTG